MNDDDLKSRHEKFYSTLNLRLEKNGHSQDAKLINTIFACVVIKEKKKEIRKYVSGYNFDIQHKAAMELIKKHMDHASLSTYDENVISKQISRIGIIKAYMLLVCLTPIYLGSWIAFICTHYSMYTDNELFGIYMIWAVLTCVLYGLYTYLTSIKFRLFWI